MITWHGFQFCHVDYSDVVYLILIDIYMKKVYYTLLIILFIACSEEDNLPDNMSLPSEEEYETELVNPDYVNIDQETTRLVECDPDKGRYTFTSNMSTEKIRPGSILTVDADTIGYIVIVQSVEKKGRKHFYNSYSWKHV